MLLCDVGNTSYHFFDGARDFRECAASFDPAQIQERVFYINVNPKLEALLAAFGWVDLGLHVSKKGYYETIGIDRLVACEATQDGLIVDVGSAITVDKMEAGRYQGGFIYPGIEAMRRAYAQLSSRLDYAFNFDIDLDKMAFNSQDAVSYGFLAPLCAEVARHDARVILTGGDAHRLLPYFKTAQHDPLLIFKGMQKIINEAALC